MYGENGVILLPLITSKDQSLQSRANASFWETVTGYRHACRYNSYIYTEPWNGDERKKIGSRSHVAPTGCPKNCTQQYFVSVIISITIRGVKIFTAPIVIWFLFMNLTFGLFSLLSSVLAIFARKCLAPKHTAKGCWTKTHVLK